MLPPIAPAGRIDTSARVHGRIAGGLRQPIRVEVPGFSASAYHPRVTGGGRGLAVFYGLPWEERLAGWVLRRQGLLRGLVRAGPVDCWCLVPGRAHREAERNPRAAWPGTPPQGGVTHVPVVEHTDRRLRRLCWYGFGPRDTPPTLDRVRLSGAVTPRELAERLTGYASVWLLDKRVAQVLVPITRAANVPTVVDLDDLENVNLRRALDLHTTRTPIDRVRRAILEREIVSWDRWNRRTVDAADRTLVTKADDAALLGDDRVVVVPNGYDLPGTASPLGPNNTTPRLLFVGDLTYDPNRDAAHRLVHEIAPRLASELCADVEVRLVGQADGAIVSPGDVGPVTVTVTGYVGDVEAELRGSDVVVVPLRLGGGTRIKVLEAWAHRVPVVSSSVGVEGLGAADGVHVLVADTPDDFASACARILREPAVRRSLVEHAYRLVADRFDWRVVEQQIATLRRDVESGR